VLVGRFQPFHNAHLAVAWMPITDIAAIEDRFHDDHFHMLDHFLGLTREGLVG